MGKTYRKDAKNAGWRRAKMDRERQKNGGRPPTTNQEDDTEQMRRDEKHGLYGGVEDVAN
jgi:hypothetical protein